MAMTWTQQADTTLDGRTLLSVVGSGTMTTAETSEITGLTGHWTVTGIHVTRGAGTLTPHLGRAADFVSGDEDEMIAYAVTTGTSDSNGDHRTVRADAWYFLATPSTSGTTVTVRLTLEK